MNGYYYATEDIRTSKALKKYFKDEKRVANIYKFLIYSGEFKDNIINLKLLDSNNLMSKDLNNDEYIFSCEPQTIASNNQITKKTHGNKIKYDISLGNIDKINEENIELFRTDDIFYFNNTSIITDGKTYYNIFDNQERIVYQILVDFKNEPLNKNIFAYKIFKEFNDKKSNLGIYLLFDKTCKENNIELNDYKYYVYKDMEKTLEIKNDDNKIKKRTI